MARFTSIVFNTGAVAAGANYDFNTDVPSNQINIGKVKVVPSAVTQGWSFALYKKTTRLAVDRQYSTKDPSLVASFYDPSDRNGGEVLQGFLIPYEDLDATGKLHGRIHNYDAVARSYAVQIDYEDPISLFANALKNVDLSAQLPGSAIVLPSLPAGTFFQLFREGLLQQVGAGKDYTRVGVNVTLAIPGIAGERLEAAYI